MRDNNEPARLADDISIHIFTVSSAMVGVCLTAVGLLHVITSIRRIATFADDIVTGDAILFLIASLCSYWALRTRSQRRHYTLEKIADAVFVIAMCVTVGACAFMTFTLSAQT